MQPRSQRRSRYIYRASRTTASSTTTAAMSGLTISNNNQSSSSSLSSTPIFPTFSPIPSASPNPSTASTTTAAMSGLTISNNNQSSLPSLSSTPIFPTFSPIPSASPNPSTASTTTAAMSGLTISNNNQSSLPSLSSTPIFPTFSPIPSASPNPSTASTTTAAMSGLTISNNNQSSLPSLSSTPIFPTFSPIPSASPNPSTAFGFFTKSASSTTPSLLGSSPAASSGLQSSDSSAAAASSRAPLFSSLFGSSCSFGESCFLGCSTGANISSDSSGSTDSRVSSSIPPPISTGSVKTSPGSETPVQEKSVIEEEKEEDSVDIPQKEDFDGIAMAADKIALLLRIQRQHPSCLSSLSLRSKSHRRASYDHLLQVIEDLKAIGCDGDGDSYAEIVASLDDLEFYGFDMRWFRGIVGEFEKNAERRLEVRKETEAKRKAREELVKQIEAIDAELAETEVPPPVSLKTLSALFE